MKLMKNKWVFLAKYPRFFIFCLLIFHKFCRLQMSEPRKSLDDTGDDESSDDDERSYETPEEKRKCTNTCNFTGVSHTFSFSFSFVLISPFAERRLDFEKRRKLHYNEFEALKLARKLLEEEEDDDDGEGGVTSEEVRALANQAQSDEQSHVASASTDNSDECANTANEVDMDNDNNS